MAQYSPPEWGSSGRNEFGIYLEVIKGGVVVETLELPRNDGRSYVLAGRMETVCDLALAHPSISRTHAALQFDEQGALFLYDIHSTHGCFVNKKRVLADEFVRLHIGDVLGFGESTRLYAICGPPELLPAEYESLNLAKFRKKLAKKREISKEKQEERGASWGFGEDAEEDESAEEDDSVKGKEELPDYLRNLKEEEDQPYKSSVSQSQVSEKDRKLYQQLQTRIRKMENLKLEKSRILAKQNQLDGLSEGQQRTLERNEQRIEALLKEIDDLEGRIHAKNDQRTKTGSASGSAARKKRNINEELYGYNSDEDDFYDRTKANKQKIAARKQKVTGSSTTASVVAMTTTRESKREVLTAESITANVKKLEDELKKLQDGLSAASAKAVENQTRAEETKEEADSLDSFMAETTSQVHVSEVDSLTKRKAEVEAELKRQRQLLAVATPAIAALPIQKPATKTVDEPVKSSSPSMVKNLSDQVQVPDAASVEKAKTTGPVPVEAAAKKPDTVLASKPASEEKKPASTNSAMPATSQAPRKTPEKESPAPKRRRISGPTMGPPQHIKTTKGKDPGGDAGVLEGGDQVWVPPTNQSGDGRTKLNDKYGY
ncbi:hypothetical protein JG687_00011494 [Phytophthora cactorum]|uniref:FHA domain-containing protein n=1 Tax=Phytophthora cactorum TaxID=29920 RepID=A0A329RQU1_9STRA|nr:hypothetical protein Pcac1_g9385 [Phytophthora cactorum]KAG2807965.1 hypothetical protein PC111_g16699 [Phytophthora cactorum]KAG2811389.1 hypothetical protein PC112_g15621 [Phytophthora cactorum]KAG2864084.1 hypothetical protein PC113_g4886 [Phytophthora cactorum]KAG2896876.1 hypothetical protein PC114_g14904 [Phytophthora cactorum]